MRTYILSNKKRSLAAMVSAVMIMSMLAFIFVIRAGAKTLDDETGEIYYKYSTMHRVCAGETLSSIAEIYMDDVHYDSVRDYVEELKKSNGLYDNDVIRSGELICVTYYSTEYK